MGPTILPDKSFIQSLSIHEAMMLSRFYTVLITPVLLQEIIRDLAKIPHIKKTPEENVAIISTKLMGSGSFKNVDYRTLAINSLLGKEPEMKGRPIIGNSKPVKSPDGKFGYVSEVSEEQKALVRWKTADFKEVEKINATIERNAMKKADLDRIAQTVLLYFPMISGCKTIADIKEQSTKDLDLFNMTDHWLDLLCYYLRVDPQIHDSIIKRAHSTRGVHLKNHAPYAYYVSQCLLLFYYGLGVRIFTERYTNIIDLEYLFYLPFAEIFVSNDKFQLLAFEGIPNEGKRIIKGDDLKNDLKLIYEKVSEYENNNPKHVITSPPPFYDGITREQWIESFPAWNREGTEWYRAKHIPDKIKDAAKRIRKTLNPEDFVPAEDSFDEPSFFFVQDVVAPTEICPFCNSGKPFNECCGKDLDKE